MRTIEDILVQGEVDTAPSSDKHHREGWINIECPFCSKGSGSYHLGINESYKYGNCYKCGSKSLWAIFSAVLPDAIKRDLRGLISELREEYHVERETGRKGPCKLPTGLEKSLSPLHKTYLRERGLNPKELFQTWGVRGIGQYGLHLKFRIFIPVILNEKTVSWTTRTVSDRVEPKYRACPVEDEQIPVKHVLFGEDYAGNEILVHEGSFDAFTIGPGATATMGTGYSRKQLLKMSAYPRRYICFDNEPEAQMRARKLCRELQTFPGITENILVDAKDINSASQKEIRLVKRLIGR